MSRLPRALPQPDARSCGAACLVVARILLDEQYADSMDVARFQADTLATHESIASVINAVGRAQLPWPRTLGTPPWAMAHALATLTDLDYHSRWGREDPGHLFDELSACATLRTPAALYTGNKLLPRHVVLAIGADDDVLRVYEPSSGRVVLTRREAFVSGRARLGWPVPWIAVLPVTPEHP